MGDVKRVEAKIILQQNDDGHWLVVGGFALGKTRNG
jgi:hypothetical protein